LKKLIPFILPLFGSAAGVGAWVFLNPPQTEMVAVQEKRASDAQAKGAQTGTEADVSTSYVKLNNQFIVPVIDKNKVSAIIVVSLSLEIAGNNAAERVYAKEPKLRDSFLQVLFDHSNIGGFHGAFTDASKIAVLRRSLLTVAQMTLGNEVTDVLITNLARQDA
jgi:flagellar basal body-associated protein FliL